MSLRGRRLIPPMSLGIAIFALVGCASWPLKPEAPHVGLTDVRLAKLSLTHPELELELLIENPNGFDLEVSSLDFVVAFGGRDFAHGNSAQGFLIPARGATEVNVTVVAETGQVLEHLRELIAPEPDLTYAMRGRIQLARWPVPLPFKVSGTLLPDQYSGAVTPAGRQMGGRDRHTSRQS